MTNRRGGGKRDRAPYRVEAPDGKPRRKKYKAPDTTVYREPDRPVFTQAGIYWYVIGSAVLGVGFILYYFVIDLGKPA